METEAFSDWPSINVAVPQGTILLEVLTLGRLLNVNLSGEAFSLTSTILLANATSFKS